jgi:hypothetical protein
LGTHFRSTFQRVSSRFGLRSFEKCFENAFPNVRSDFQNLRLGSMKLLQKIVASQKTQHIASHVATIFCNHLAKLLQKTVASQKNQHIASRPRNPRIPIHCLRLQTSRRQLAPFLERISISDNSKK